MVNEKASKWVIGIVIYFILLSAVFVVVNGFKTEYDLDDDEYINSSGGGYSGFEILSCSAPRFESGSADGSGWAGLERDLYNPRYSLMFKEGLIYDQETCESYEGASWVEDKIFFFWGTGTYTCSGTINQTYYNDGVTYTNFTATGIWANPVCGLSALQESQDLCESFGCTFYTDSDIDDLQAELSSSANIVNKFWSVLKTIADILTLKLNFYTGNTYINGLLTFFLIWLPIIAMLFSIYELVRG
jgi:hypothetical protein